MTGSYDAKATVKMGPMSLTYKGTAEITESDPVARTAVLKAKGTDQKGQGTAQALMSMAVEPDGEGSRVKMSSDILVSGRVAQMGRGIMENVATRMIGEMAKALEATLQTGETVRAETPGMGAVLGSDLPPQGRLTPRAQRTVPDVRNATPGMVSARDQGGLRGFHLMRHQRRPLRVGDVLGGLLPQVRVPARLVEHEPRLERTPHLLAGDQLVLLPLLGPDAHDLVGVGEAGAGGHDARLRERAGDRRQPGGGRAVDALGAELVDHDHAARRQQQRGALGGGADVLHVVQRAAEADGVERTVVQPVGAESRVDDRCLDTGQRPAGDGADLLGRVDRRHLVTRAGHFQRHGAVAAADVEHAAPALGGPQRERGGRLVEAQHQRRVAPERRTQVWPGRSAARSAVRSETVALTPFEHYR